ncbi:splicing factor ESS-2 homolog isoform X2 [Schistocerca gregaria]|uniref:splicing factor ESS-2 homolog isoform X2 n=1 Tax=Schistocerca gregaria TaxID=7010 RepID=UPI00211F2BDE|nr:splicing factor ESS-2 homolog isoform X2 [Schistocerca gregaria]
MTPKTVSSGKTLVLVRDENGSGSLLPAPSPQVLDEDVYTKKIDQIVQKDYFPDLPKLKARVEWTSAARYQNILAMEEIKKGMGDGQKFSTGATYGGLPESLQSPSSGRESLEVAKGGGVDDRGLDVALLERQEIPEEGQAEDMSLDEFIVKYTSEDDASFFSLVEKESMASKKRLWKIEEMGRKNMKVFESGHVPRVICASDSRDALMDFPDSIQMDNCPAFSRFNKEIRRENTRFVGCIWKDEKKAARDKDGFLIPLQGKPTVFGLKKDDREVMSSPRLPSRLHSFVTVPSPNPHAGLQSPFITWGEIDEPQLLDECGNLPLSESFVKSADKSIPGAYEFHIPQQSPRQLAANHLARQASLSKKKKETTGNRTPLLGGESIKTSSFLGHSENKIDVDSQLRASYSPMVNSGLNVKLTPVRKVDVSSSTRNVSH